MATSSHSVTQQHLLCSGLQRMQMHHRGVPRPVCYTQGSLRKSRTAACNPLTLSPFPKHDKSGSKRAELAMTLLADEAVRRSAAIPNNSYWWPDCQQTHMDHTCQAVTAMHSNNVQAVCHCLKSPQTKSTSCRPIPRGLSASYCLSAAEE